jgi:hypothetical protein
MLNQSEENLEATFDAGAIEAGVGGRSARFAVFRNPMDFGALARAAANEGCGV